MRFFLVTFKNSPPFTLQNITHTGMTGLLLGVYATTNGEDGDTPAYISNWQYRGFEQYLD